MSTVKRDENGRDSTTGRFTTGNAGGGRTALPDWFRDKGPSFLETLVKVAEGKLVDENVSQAQAVLACIDRIYGKPKQAPEDVDAMARAWADMLSRLRGGEEP